MLPNSEKDFLKRHIGPSKEDQLKMKDPSEMDTLMNKDDYDKFAKETSA